MLDDTWDEEGRAMDVVIRNGLVVTLDERLGTLSEADVAIRGGAIAEVGPRLRCRARDEIDATGCIVMPGLVDAHRHLFSPLLRGCAANASYEEYFQEVILTYGASYTPDDTRAAMLLGTLESIDAGTTTIHAWEHNLLTPDHADASIQAFLESGVRGRFSYGPPNQPPTIDLDDLLRVRDEYFADRAGRYFVDPSGLVHLGLATRGVEFGRPDIWIREFNWGREHELPLTAHVMEGAVSELRAHDAFGPDLLAIHLHGATDEELEHVRGAGAPVCVAPPALARAGIGRSPVKEMIDLGIPLSLSVDSTAGCDTADMLAVMRISVLIERAHHASVDAYRPEDALRHATIGGARALGLGEVTGTLTPGKRADVIVLRVDGLNFVPLNAPEAQIVLCGQPRNVDAVFIDGVCRKRDGALVGYDVARTLDAAREAAGNLVQRTACR
jgi:5-methylthioadenosine/S-adenosylhomocysteine deaminase